LPEVLVMADRYVKNTGADGNTGTSWQTAFQTVQRGIDDCAATGGGIVHVEHGYYAENLTMRSGVSLVGYGQQPGLPPIESPALDNEAELCPNKPILDGSNNATVITCAGVQNVAIDNFNIIRGKGSNNDRGGGVYISGTAVRINACCIIQNVAADFGGGVCVDSGSSNIDFRDDLFWFNSSDGGGGMAIIETKVVNIIDCQFLQNTNGSTQGKGGGAIHVRKCKDIIVDDVEFTTNSSNDLGGAILITACSQAIPSVTVRNSRFNGNTAKLSGGGIMVTDKSFISVSDVEFVSNHADTDGGGLAFNNRGLPAGGVFNPAAVRTAGQFSPVTNCRFENNTAGDDGGGLYLTAATMVVATDCTFRSNSAQENGGGLECTFGSAIDITDCAFEFNVAETGNGGGFTLRDADLQASDVVLRHNVSRRGQGGGIFLHTESQTTTATALFHVFLTGWGFVTRGARAVIADVLLEDNFARTGGGGIGSRGGNYPLSVAVRASTFNNNRVQDEGFGGGFMAENVSVSLADNNFDRNQVFMPGVNSRGGAVAGISCPSFAMTGGTVTHNRANYGGGVALQACPNPTLAGVTFNRNFITVPPGRGEDIHTQGCLGVTVGALLNANPTATPGQVVVLP
jgi:predicted outer membrane repeat protein